MRLAQPRRQETLERQAGRGAAALASSVVPPATTSSPRSFGCACGRAGLAELRGSLSPGRGHGSPGAAEAPQGAWASLAPAWALCGFSAASFCPPPPTPHPNKPTLRKRWVAAKALSWPLPSWRFSTSREGGLYHQPRFRQEPFHPNLCISVRSGPETWSRRQACIDCPACPLRCDIFLLRLSSGHPGWGVRRC